MKHSPAPWTTEPHGSTIALYSGRDDRHHGARLMNLDDGNINFEANARLIASAPELLEALKGLLNAMLFGSIVEEQRAGARALKVIEKAEGA